MPKLNFSPEQRLIIALLCDLYKEPDKREFRGENVSLIMDAVCSGHDWAIDWEMGAMFPEEADTDEQVHFVADVLDMWEFIELSWSKLDDGQKQKVRDAVPHVREPEFAGFDGNNEGEYLAIARMLVKKMGRFQTFKSRSLNSHSYKVDRYRQMLTRWPAIRETLDMKTMTAEQLTELLSLE